MSELWIPKGTMSTRRNPAGDKIHLDADWILHTIPPAAPALPLTSKINQVAMPPLVKSSFVPSGTVWAFPLIPWITSMPSRLWNWIKSGYDEVLSEHRNNVRIAQLLRETELAYLQAHPGTQNRRRGFLSPWWLLLPLLGLLLLFPWNNCTPPLGSTSSVTTQPTAIPIVPTATAMVTPAPVPSTPVLPTQISNTPVPVIPTLRSTQSPTLVLSSDPPTLPHSGEPEFPFIPLGLTGLAVLASGLYISRFSR